MERSEATTPTSVAAIFGTNASNTPAATPEIAVSQQSDLATGADVSQRPMIVSRSRIGPPLPELEPLSGSQSSAVADAAQPKPGAITWKRPADSPQAGKADQLSDSTKDGQLKPIAPAGAGRKINVNKATAVELELLPDVGPALAKRILDHRAKNGPFKVLDDLDKVSGIGPKTLEKLKDRIVFVDPPAPR
jgi:comEA protein